MLRKSLFRRNLYSTFNAKLNNNFNRRVSTNTSKLFSAISELDRDYGIKLKSFPKVVVVGPQSSGKSSVIEAICGETILPKAMRMATLKEIHLTTIRSHNKKFKVASKEFNTDRE